MRNVFIWIPDWRFTRQVGCQWEAIIGREENRSKILDTLLLIKVEGRQCQSQWILKLELTVWLKRWNCFVFVVRKSICWNCKLELWSDRWFSRLGNCSNSWYNFPFPDVIFSGQDCNNLFPGVNDLFVECMSVCSNY